jgi:hypothetical protein
MVQVSCRCSTPDTAAAADLRDMWQLVIVCVNAAAAVFWDVLPGSQKLTHSSHGSHKTQGPADTSKPCCCCCCSTVQHNTKLQLQYTPLFASRVPGQQPSFAVKEHQALHTLVQQPPATHCGHGALVCANKSCARRPREQCQRRAVQRPAYAMHAASISSRVFVSSS